MQPHTVQPVDLDQTIFDTFRDFICLFLSSWRFMGSEPYKTFQPLSQNVSEFMKLILGLELIVDNVAFKICCSSTRGPKM